MRMDHSSLSSSSEDGPNSLLPPLPPPPPAQVVVRPDEVAIVVVVLMLWAAAIALFINRWGKIRLMEPYQVSKSSHSQKFSFAIYGTYCMTQMATHGFRRQQI